MFINSEHNGMLLYMLTNSQIYNNTVVQLNDQYAAIMGWMPGNPVYLTGLGTRGFDNNVIQNNIFYGGILLPRAQGVKIKYKNGTEIQLYTKFPYESSSFFNNTLERLEQGDNTRLGKLIYESTFGSNNSVVYNGSGYSVTEYTSGKWITTADLNSRTNASDNMTVDPLFNSMTWSSAENFGNYSLKTNSTAIGSGKIISNYLTDLLGNLIPSDTKPDRGAIQSSSSISPPPPPASGTDLFKPLLGSYESSIGSWVKYGSNIVQTSSEFAQIGSRSLKISYGSSHTGAYLYLSKQHDLTENLIVGNAYTLTFWAKTNSGTVKLVIRDALKAINSYQVLIDNSIKKYEINFIATHSNYNYIKLEGLMSGQSVLIDDLQLLSGNTGNNDPSLTSIVNSPSGGYESNIGSWKQYGSNTIQTSSEYFNSGSKSLKVSYVNSHTGGYLYLNKSYDLTSNLVVGNQYKLSFWAKTNSGSANVVLRDALKSINDYSIVVTSTAKKHEILFNATNSIYNYIKFERLSSGQSIYIDDLELYDLSESSNGPIGNNSLSKIQLDINADVANGEVNLSWFNLDENIENYEVQRTNAGMEKIWNTIQTVSNSSEMLSLIDKPAPGNYIYRIQLISKNGSSELSSEISVTVVPDNFELFQNYPNPFNPTTKVKFAIPSQSKVHLSVFNILGEQIAVLNNETLEAGTHEMIWNATLLPSGTYLLKINAESLNGENTYSEVKKMMLIK
jgi:hypothetical protein